MKLYKSKSKITTIKQSFKIINQTINTNNEMKSIGIFTIASAVASAMDYPGDRCCTLYEKVDFEGYKNTFCLDASENEK